MLARKARRRLRGAQQLTHHPLSMGSRIAEMEQLTKDLQIRDEQLAQTEAVRAVRASWRSAQ